MRETYTVTNKGEVLNVGDEVNLLVLCEGEGKHGFLFEGNIYKGEDTDITTISDIFEIYGDEHDAERHQGKGNIIAIVYYGVNQLIAKICANSNGIAAKAFGVDVREGIKID